MTTRKFIMNVLPSFLCLLVVTSSVWAGDAHIGAMRQIKNRALAEHLEWVDGYYQELPRVAPPSAGETQYVYREITAEQPVTVEIDCIIRAPESAGGWGLCKSGEGKPVFAGTDDPDYQKILSSLKRVLHRVEPGVKDLLATKARDGGNGEK